MAAHIVFFVVCLQVLLVRGDDSTICKDSGWTSGAHPYPYDCQHYVLCNGTLTIVHACSEGTFYDAAVRACLADNHGRPCLANQDLSTPPSYLDANICSHNGWVFGIHPYPTDCNHYVYCVNYNTHIVVCPPGTSFDTRVNGCLDTSDAEPCKATTTPAPTTTTTPARNTTITITDSNICSHNGWVFGTHPYPTDCSRYVICINSVTHVVICAPGTRFDKRVKDCLVTSYAEPCYTNDQWTDMAGICNKFNLVDGIYPDPGACSKFVECVSANTYHMECPGSLMFNSRLLVCDEAYDVTCTDNYFYNFQNIIIG